MHVIFRMFWRRCYIISQRWESFFQNLMFSSSRRHEKEVYIVKWLLSGRAVISRYVCSKEMMTGIFHLGLRPIKFNGAICLRG